MKLLQCAHWNKIEWQKTTKIQKLISIVSLMLNPLPTNPRIQTKLQQLKMENIIDSN